MNWKSLITRFFATCILACPLFAQAATPLSVYQSMIVPLPLRYANQGIFWAVEGGIPTISSLEFLGHIFETCADADNDPMTIPDEPILPFDGLVSMKIDSGMMAGIMFGYRYYRLRFELETAGYLSTIGSMRGFPTNRFNLNKKNDDDDFGRFLGIGLLGNVLFDGHIPGTGINPFIGGGIGPMYIQYSPCITTLNNEDVDLKNACFQFAYQLIIGCGCTITSHIEMDLAFKYLTTKVGDDKVKLPPACAETEQHATFFLKRDGVINFSTFVVEFRFS